MVDFRYHLVSLISVFIALSVGVILGAGPLQNAIGEALTSEAATLRDSNAELKQQAERAHVRAQKQDQAFNTLAPALLKNTLAGQNVAIVRTPGVTDAVYAAVTAKLQLSGAQLGTVLGLTNLWVDAQQNSYRSAFAQQISTYVKGVATGADADTALGVALSQVLRAGSTDPNNATLVQVMSESDTPLLEKSAKLSGAADVVLVLTPDARAPQASGDKKTDAQATAVVEYTRTMLVKLVETLASKGATVVAGAA
ncbi:MAG: copper transporter, partial [Arcanobacterium sp.]|nr:copper transporter [Arcanobacterium sp.]